MGTIKALEAGEYALGLEIDRDFTHPVQLQVITGGIEKALKEKGVELTFTSWSPSRHVVTFKLEQDIFEKHLKEVLDKYAESLANEDFMPVRLSVAPVDKVIAKKENNGKITAKEVAQVSTLSIRKEGGLKADHQYILGNIEQELSVSSKGQPRNQPALGSLALSFSDAAITVKGASSFNIRKSPARGILEVIPNENVSVSELNNILSTTAHRVQEFQLEGGKAPSVQLHLKAATSLPKKPLLEDLSNSENGCIGFAFKAAIRRSVDITNGEHFFPKEREPAPETSKTFFSFLGFGRKPR